MGLMGNRYGYLTIDHRASPGIPGSKHLREGSFYEADTRRCAHCPTVVVMNPLRERARFTCPRCQSYCCDVCAVAYSHNYICRPVAQVIDDLKSGRTPLPLLAKDMKG